MKVHELIKELKKMDPDAELIIASDDEGNEFRVFNGFGGYIYALTEEVEKGYIIESLLNVDEYDDDEEYERVVCIN